MTIDSGTAVLISACAATLGWLYNARRQRDTARRQHTYAILQHHNDWPRFDKALLSVRRMIRTDTLPGAADLARSRDIATLDFLLDYYEYLSAAVWCGDLDEQLLRETERTRLTNLAAKLKNYIEDVRHDAGSEDIWISLQLLARRWQRRETTGDRVYDHIIQTLIGRPSPTLAAEKAAR